MFSGKAGALLLALRGHSSLLYKGQLILLYFSVKAKQVTFLKKTGIVTFCLFLTENLV